MRQFGLVILMTFAVNCSAQKGGASAKVIDREFGNVISSGAKISGSGHVFSERIHEYYFDTITNTVTLQLRGTSKNGKWLNHTGEIIMYDLVQAQIRWRKAINYNLSSVEQRNSLIMESAGMKSSRLDIQSGKSQWEVKNSIYFFDPIAKIGMGYEPQKSIKKPTTKLIGINLSNGKEVWSREIPREYGWNSILHLSDTVVGILASGIYTIDLRNGSGWDFNAVTGQHDYSGMVAANAAGVALGLLTGTYMVSSGHNTVTSIASNVESDASFFYMASKENVVCIDKIAGKVIWNTRLPKDLMSKATLFMVDSMLYLVGRGFAFMGGKQLEYGKPFLAAYDSKNGNQKYLVQMPVKGSIGSLQIRGGAITLIFKNSALQYSLKDGELMTTEAYSPDVFGDLQYFVGDQIYLVKDSTYENLSLTDTTKLFVYTTKEKVLIVDDMLKVQGQIGIEDLLIFYEKYKGYRFLEFNGKTVIVNSDLKRVAELTAPRNSTLIGKTLFYVEGNSLNEIDLSQILKD